MTQGFKALPEQHHINVDLGDRGYPIVIGQDLLGGSFDLSRHVAGQHCQIVTNETVAPLYLDRLKDSLPGRKVDTVVLPDGEKYKTVETLVRVFDGLTDAGARRDTTVIALGGGVVGDIAGFAAASYMRGVPYIQVPTTLLAQVDSSVGGKTGVNHAAGKNLIGAFYQPRVVLIDTNTLTTLPDRELKAGLAEVIKHGAICDAAFFEWLEYNIQALLEQDAQALGEAIRRCCQIKSDVVAEDERETGRRAILNFGHTFGHAIERCQGFGSWLHGEAVAAGMVMAASLSGLDVSEQARLSGLIAAAGLPIAAPAIPSKDMRKAMGLDKKAVGESLRFVLLKKLGEAFVTSDYDENLLEAVLGQS